MTFDEYHTHRRAAKWFNPYDETGLRAFEAANPGFRPVAVADLVATPTLTDAARATLAKAANGHTLRLSPASTGTDGFFIALYERT